MPFSAAHKLVFSGRTTSLLVLVSIHARAARGGRRLGFRCKIGDHSFQSTRPARGATENGGTLASVLQFQSTRPARGATNCRPRASRILSVSIHAPRAGRDCLHPNMSFLS